MFVAVSLECLEGSPYADPTACQLYSLFFILMPNPGASVGGHAGVAVFVFALLIAW